MLSSVTILNGTILNTPKLNQGQLLFSLQNKDGNFFIKASPEYALNKGDYILIYCRPKTFMVKSRHQTYFEVLELHHTQPA